MNPSGIEKMESNLVKILTGPFPDFMIYKAKSEVWVPVDTRPLSRKMAEFQLLSWFRRVHHGRLLEKGISVQTLTPESDSDDDGLYD